MTELKHAEVICHMAKHGFESVEYRPPHSDYWCQNIYSNCNPVTHPDCEWRIKPATITYTVTVLEPMRVMPRFNQHYYYCGARGVGEATCKDDEVDKALFDLGNIWDTEAKAQAAFDALFGPLRATK